MEIIDSSEMTILADFRYVDEPVNNIEHYYLGILQDKFMVRVQGLEGNTRGDFFFDRDNYSAVTDKVEDVYAGKLLNEPNNDYFSFKSGKDFFIIGITATMPHTVTKPIVKFKLMNKRRAIIDDLELGGWDLYMSVETGKLMLKEMKKIKNQVVN